MKKIWILVIVLVGVSVIFWPSFKGLVVKDDGLVACTMEAKLCPDGSAVGRSGPQCEFAPCPTVITPAEPAPAPAVGNVTLAVGQTGKVGNITIKLNSIVQDNRCPIDVQCIIAGALTVNTTLTSGNQSETRNFSSDAAPYIFVGQPISLINIPPPRDSRLANLIQGYLITFQVGK